MDLKPIEKLKPFQKFCMTIGELPSSYLESMTYAEMLMWFCDFLQNTVIPTVNNNAEAVEELQALFINLHDYVENYFNNLDVQEEINNKLDNMVEDGTFSLLLEPYLTQFNNRLNQQDALINTKFEQQNTLINSMRNGAPLTASSTAGMTDTTKVYVNTTDGYWYYYNGTNWVQGGVYQSTGLSNNAVYFKNLSASLLNHISKYSLLKNYTLQHGYISDNGTFNAAGQRLTDHLLLESGTKIILNDLSKSIRIAKYDLNQTFISVQNYNENVIIEDTAYYRIGDILNQISGDGFYDLITIYTSKGINDAFNNIDDIYNNLYKYNPVTNYVVQYGYITNAGQFNSASQRITQYILLHHGSTIKLNDPTKQIRVAKFNMNKEFVSVANYNEDVVIDDTGYYRIGDILNQITPSVADFYNLITIEDALNIATVYDKLATKSYVVDINGNGDYTSLMDCFTALAGNENKKTIYIKAGTYDVFEEIGGKTFCESIPEDATDWKLYSIMVPPNTHLVGLGEVNLEFLPEVDDIPAPAYTLLSCLNVQGSVEIENIKIKCKNCRYAIHDETSENPLFSNTTKIYRNVEARKLQSDVGYAQVFGSGFHDGIEFIFENCKFIHDTAGTPMSFHNAANYGSNNIIIKDCIFINNSTANSQLVFFNSSHHTQLYNNVKISNSYISNRIGIGINGNVQSSINAFKITMNNCNDVPIYIPAGVTNILTPEIYNTIS